MTDESVCSSHVQHPTRKPMPYQHHPGVFRIRPLRYAIAVSLTLASLTAFAQGNAPTPITAEAAARSWNLPAAPLADTLARIARDSGQRLSADPALVAGKTSAPVRGNFSTADAARQVLIGTGLELVVTESGTLSVRPVPPLENNARAMLAPVTVRADAARESAWGPVQGYVARRSATGTKTDTPLIETPQSVSVVTREQMEIQGVDTLDQAFRYSAGVVSQSGNGGNSGTAGTSLLMRGFSSGGFSSGGGSLYLDGRKFPINSITGVQEPFLYERVELLKGPASILYGQASPGGIVNLVSKRPTSEPLRQVGLQVGSWNRQRATIDLGGPVTEDGRLGYRITGLMQDSDTMIAEIPDDRQTLSTAVDWRATDRTTLTLLATLHESEAAYNYGKPFDGTVLPNPNGRVAPDLFVGERGFDGMEVSRNTLGYELEHQFNDTWTVRHNLLWYDTETDWAYHWISNRTDDATRRLVNRGAQRRIDEEAGVTVDNQVQTRWHHGRLQHTSLVGMDYRNSKFDQRVWVGTNQPLDVFNPEYGNRPVMNDGIARATRIDYGHLGIYAQNQTKFDDRWIVLLGGRWDDVDLRNRQTDANGNHNRLRAKATELTWRAGVVYLFDNDLAPYASYSESFEPSTGVDASGSGFDPTTGRQYEVGFKYEPVGTNATLTVAVYELTQQNVLTADPDNPGFSVQTGEVRSRGFEVEGRAHLRNNLDLIAAYTYTDNEVTRSNDPNRGNTTAAVPRNAVSLWADYHVLSGPADGLSMGGGIRYVGRTFNNDNSFKVPSCSGQVAADTD
ncbi:hypothetical protein CKO35_16750 [Ectothiorhodospira shaposhnikovii]|nr:hypothetical protein [Ectothiorhodospira shaposhnikovii]